MLRFIFFASRNASWDVQDGRLVLDRRESSVFATGYGLDGMPPQWRARPVVQKPFEAAGLAAALRSVLAR